jgi:serine phosphatase RsbU (regulator of sigma subunit)
LNRINDIRPPHTRRWSNAGHPPRSLLDPGGTARLLHEPLQLLLGTGLTTHRSDHTISLEPGAKVVFYTDGLIERRDEPLDDSMRTLLEELTDQHLLSAEQLCDHLLGRHMA